MSFPQIVSGNLKRPHYRKKGCSWLLVKEPEVSGGRDALIEGDLPVQVETSFSRGTMREGSLIKKKMF
jgi:hypothetical protein